ncbi:MAG: leucyl/phenylalanyl-tRNA--protein transferase [Gammaproteobacteria bacterium]
MSLDTIHWLSAGTAPDSFPDANAALREPDGLLAAGGDLTPERLLAAYRKGIFPWYEEGQPILWWSPDPRTVLYVDDMHVSRSLRRTLRRRTFEMTIDRAFAGVMSGCARRESPTGTWITRDMRAAFQILFELGHAHSVECWRDGTLAGGVYGLALGRVFFGESMFSRRSDASKVALHTLAEYLRERGFAFIDCQVASPHLASLGAVRIPRRRFLAELAAHVAEELRPGRWEYPCQ